MTINTNGAGVACCGNCGSELEVRCTGHCAEPDIVPRENYIAALPLPKGPGRRAPRAKRRSTRKFLPGICTYKSCTEPIAPHVGIGRPTTKCPKHLEWSRTWTRNHNVKKAVA